MKEINHTIPIIGLSIMTSNKDALENNTIATLWNEFIKNPINEKLTNIISPTVFAVYSEFENGDKGRYRITIGYEVDTLNSVPDGLHAVTIQKGIYNLFQSKSLSPQHIVETWQTIWEKSANELPRNFVTDFEEYGSNEMTIHIGRK